MVLYASILAAFASRVGASVIRGSSDRRARSLPWRARAPPDSQTVPSDRPRAALRYVSARLLRRRTGERRHVDAVAFGAGGEVKELADRGSDRLAQRLRLGRRFAGAARSTSGVQQYGERTGCKADGSYPSAKAKFSH